jgi:hypothetical protein
VPEKAYRVCGLVVELAEAKTAGRESRAGARSRRGSLRNLRRRLLPFKRLAGDVSFVCAALHVELIPRPSFGPPRTWSEYVGTVFSAIGIKPKRRRRGLTSPHFNEVLELKKRNGMMREK